MSHSKRNTSLAFFTAYEREEAGQHWGSKSTRLTRESFLPFGSCLLCLLPARDPVSCPSHGHLFCRECAVNNLLAQNKELKRLKKEAEKRKLEDAKEKEVEDAEAQARALEEFERVQAGLSVRTGGKAGDRIVGRSDGKITIEQDLEGGNKGVKRKFEVDEDELVRLAKEGEHKNKKREPNASDAGTELPSFWVPSKIPEHKKGEIKAIRSTPVCPAALPDQTHDFTLKTLMPVHFTEDKPAASSETPARTCPSCNKALSNSTKAILAKPCGHVLCKPCSDKFQKPSERSAHVAEHDDSVRCYVCQEDITPGRKMKKREKKDDGKKEKESKTERGLVELSTEGTGFAGGGNNVVKKQGVAFQC
ncbi:hypothetical protein KC315_g4585 [Hortaea werneckii]|nr:hypothetical protein KC315_g4585 [Hortaea werneckii]